ncbi:MAG: hypothetical protein M3220_21020, partial [Chloroflexota bacterium]|nr:hypothetical protein [Chloroflexota bacterium]
AIQDLFEELNGTHFPFLGKTIGDFVLYDSLLMGMASSLINGCQTDVDDVLMPDETTLDFVRSIKEKGDLVQIEREFIDYYDGLERLRAEMVRCISESNGNFD